MEVVRKRALCKAKCVESDEVITGFYFENASGESFVRCSTTFKTYWVDASTVCQYWMTREGVDYFEGDRVLVDGTKSIGVYETVVVYNDLCTTIQDNKTGFAAHAVRIAVIGKAEAKQEETNEH